jgi:hypothetical protein
MITFILTWVLKHIGTCHMLEYGKDLSVTRYTFGNIVLIEKHETLSLYRIKKHESIVFHAKRQPLTQFEIFDIFKVNSR